MKHYYSNEATRADAEFTIEVYLIGIVTVMALLLIVCCLCRFYCVARRLRTQAKNELSKSEINKKAVAAAQANRVDLRSSEGGSDGEEEEISEESNDFYDSIKDEGASQS